MKKLGYVLAVIGGLSFAGAFGAGHSITGPITFLVLGVYLIHRANEKEKESNNNQ